MSTFFVILHDAEPASDDGRAFLRENLQSKLGLQPERIEQIFESLPVILKENMEEADADSYVRVLERLGASVEKLPENSESSIETSAETEELSPPQSDELEGEDTAKAYELDLDADYSVEDLESMLDEVLESSDFDEPAESTQTQAALDVTEPVTEDDDELSFAEMSAGLEFHLSGETEELHTGADKPVASNEAELADSAFSDLELAPVPEQLETTEAPQELDSPEHSSEEVEFDYSLNLPSGAPEQAAEKDENSFLTSEAEEFNSAEETLSTLSKEFDFDGLDSDNSENRAEEELPEEDFEDALIARLESGVEEENRISADSLEEESQAAEVESDIGLPQSDALEEEAPSRSDLEIPPKKSIQRPKAELEDDVENKTAQLVSRATVWVGVVVLLLGTATLVFMPELLTGESESEQEAAYDPAPGMIEALLKQQAEILGKVKSSAASGEQGEAKPEVREWRVGKESTSADFRFTANILTVDQTPAFLQLEATTKKPAPLSAEELVDGVSRPWLHKINAPNIKIEQGSLPSQKRLFGSARGYIDDRGHRGRLLLEVEVEFKDIGSDSLEGILELRHGNIREKLEESEGMKKVHYVGRANSESFAVLIRAPFTARALEEPAKTAEDSEDKKDNEKEEQ